jgi:hypothetical protein
MTTTRKQYSPKFKARAAGDSRVVELDVENPRDAATRAGIGHASRMNRLTKDALEAGDEVHASRVSFRPARVDGGGRRGC